MLKNIKMGIHYIVNNTMYFVQAKEETSLEEICQEVLSNIKNGIGDYYIIDYNGKRIIVTSNCTLEELLDMHGKKEEQSSTLIPGNNVVIKRKGMPKTFSQ